MSAVGMLNKSDAWKSKTAAPLEKSGPAKDEWSKDKRQVLTNTGAQKQSTAACRDEDYSNSQTADFAMIRQKLKATPSKNRETPEPKPRIPAKPSNVVVTQPKKSSGKPVAMPKPKLDDNKPSTKQSTTLNGKVMIPEKKPVAKMNSAKASLGYSRQIVASLLQELSLPHDVSFEVRLESSDKSNAIIHGLSYAKSLPGENQSQLVLMDDIGWEATRQGNCIHLRPDTNEESRLNVNVEWPKPFPTTMTICKVEDETGHFIASAPAISWRTGNVQSASLTATLGDTVFQRNGTLHCSKTLSVISPTGIKFQDNFNANCERAAITCENEMIVEGTLSASMNLAKRGVGRLHVTKGGKLSFTDLISELVAEGRLAISGSLNASSQKLRIGDSVEVFPQGRWTAAKVSGIVNGKLTISGLTEWEQIGTTDIPILAVEECIFDETASLTFNNGGTLVVSKEFKNKTSKINWNGMLNVAAFRLLQDTLAGFSSEKGSLTIRTESQADEDLNGMFEVAKLTLHVNGHVRCKATLSVGSLKVFVHNGSGVTFLTPIALDGPFIAETQSDSSETIPHSKAPSLTFQKPFEVLGSICASQLGLRLQKGAFLRLKARMFNKHMELCQLFASEIATEKESILHCIPIFDKEGENCIFQMNVANSWQHRGTFSSEGSFKAMLLTVGSNLTVWPSARIDLAQFSIMHCSGNFRLEKGTKLCGQLHVEINAGVFEMKPGTKLSCWNNKEAKLMVKVASALKNSGEISGPNIVVVSANEFHNTRSGTLSATDSITIGGSGSVLNDGVITVKNGPLRIIAVKLDNFYGKLVSEDEDVQVELYDVGNAKVSGLISTRKALIVKAPSSSSLNVNVKMATDENRPKLMFVHGSASGETFVNCPIELAENGFARFIIGPILKLNTSMTVEKCEIGLMGGDHSIYVKETVKFRQLKIVAALPKTSLSILGSGTIEVEELIVENVSSLSIALSLTANSVVITDVVELCIAAGSLVTFLDQPIVKDLKSMRVEEGAFISFNGTMKMSSGRIESQGSIALPNGNIVCKELNCGDKSRLILGTPISFDSMEVTGEFQKNPNGKKITRRSNVQNRKASLGVGKKVAMFAASSFFGDPFVQNFLPSLSKIKIKEALITKKQPKPNIYIAGAEAVSLNGRVLCTDPTRNIMLLCDSGNTVIKGLIDCETDITVVSKTIKMSGTVNCSSGTFQAIESMKITRKGTFNCQRNLVLRAGKLEKKKAPVQPEDDTGKGNWSKEKESKFRQFKNMLKECFAEFPTIILRGKVFCSDLLIRAKIVVLAVTKDIKVERTLNINAWVFANLLTIVQASNIQLAIQIVGVNIGALFAWRTFSVTCLSFANLAFIHAPLMTISGIVVLLLLGVTFSFSRFIKAIIKVELLHAALPTVPTKDLLKNPVHIINALLTTLQQLVPVPARAALMIVQSGLMLLGLFKTFFTLAVKLKGMVEKIRQEGIVSMPIQLTDIIGILVDCVSAWTIFEAGVNQISQGVELSKIETATTISSDELEVDLQKAAITMIGNFIMPTMSETSVLSDTSGLRVGYSITDRGVYGNNSGITLTGGTYMADYVTSYVNHGSVLACGDVIVSTKYLEMTGKTQARGDVRYNAETVVAENIMAFGDFKAMVTGSANISGARAGNIEVGETREKGTEQTVPAKNVDITVSKSDARNGLAIMTASGDVRLQESSGVKINVSTAGSVLVDDSRAADMQLQGESIHANRNVASSTFSGLATRDAEVNRLDAGVVEIVGKEGSATLSGASVNGHVEVNAKGLVKVSSTKASGDIAASSAFGIGIVEDSSTKASVLASGTKGALILGSSADSNMTALSIEGGVSVAQSSARMINGSAGAHIQMDDSKADNAVLVGESIGARNNTITSSFKAFSSNNINVSRLKAGTADISSSEGSASIADSTVSGHVALAAKYSARITGTKAAGEMVASSSAGSSSINDSSSTSSVLASGIFGATISGTSAATSMAAMSSGGSASVKQSRAAVINAAGKNSVHIDDSLTESMFAQGESVSANNNAAKSIFRAQAVKDANISGLIAGNIEIAAKDGSATLSGSSAARGHVALMAKHFATITGTVATGDVIASSSQGTATIAQSKTNSSAVASGVSGAKITSTTADASLTALASEQGAEVTHSNASNITAFGNTHVRLEDSKSDTASLQGHSINASRNVTTGSLKALASANIDISHSKSGDIAATSNDGSVSLSDATATGNVALLARRFVTAVGTNVEGDIALSSNDESAILINASGRHINISAKNAARMFNVQGTSAALSGHSVTAVDNTFAGNFGAFATGDAYVQDLKAGDIAVSSLHGTATVTDTFASGSIELHGATGVNVGNIKSADSITAVSSKGYVSINDATATNGVAVKAATQAIVDDVRAHAIGIEADVVRAGDIQSNELSVRANRHAIVEGSMDVGNAYIKGDRVTFQHQVAEQLFGTLHVRAEQQLDNLDAILYRSNELSKLRVTKALNLEIPRQDVIFDRRLHAEHALSIDAKSVTVRDHVPLSTQGNLNLKTQESITAGAFSKLTALAGSVNLQSTNGNVVLEQNASIAGDRGAKIIANNGAITLNSGSAVTAGTGDVDILAKQNVAVNKANVTASGGKVQIVSDEGLLKLAASKVHGEQAVTLSGHQGVQILSEVSYETKFDRGHFFGFLWFKRPTITEKVDASSISTNGSLVVYSKAGGVDVGRNGQLSAQTGVAILAEGGGINLQKGSQVQTATGNALLRAHGDVNLNFGNVTANGGQAVLRSDQGNVRLHAANVHGEGGAFLSAHKNVDIEADVQARHNGKTYFRSNVTAGKGQAYEFTQNMSDGTTRTTTRNAGVIIESETGDINLDCSSVQSVGDVHLNAKKGNVNMKADSYEYEASRYEKSSWFGLKKETIVTMATHIERPGIKTGGMVVASTGGDLTTAAAKIETADGVSFNVAGKIRLNDVVGSISTSYNKSIVGGLIGGHKVDTRQEISVPTEITATNPNSITAIKAGEGLYMIGSSISTPGLTRIDAPIVEIKERILQYHRKEEEWGFYAEAPMVEMLSSEQRMRQTAQSMNPFKPAITTGNKNSTAVSVINAVNGAFEVANTAEEINQMYRKVKKDPMETFASVGFGYGYRKEEQRQQYLAGNAYIQTGALEINANKLSLLDGASLSAQDAVFNVREFVIKGAELHSSYNSESYKIGLTANAASQTIAGVNASVDLAASETTVHQNAQISITGHAQFKNVDQLTVQNANISVGKASGEIKNAHFETSLGSESSSSTSVSATVGFNGMVSGSFGMSSSEGNRIGQQTTFHIGEGGSSDLHVGNVHLKGAAILNDNSQSVFTAGKVTSENLVERFKADAINLTPPASDDPAAYAKVVGSSQRYEGVANATIANTDGTQIQIRNREGQVIDMQVNTDIGKMHEVTRDESLGINFGMSLASVQNFFRTPNYSSKIPTEAKEQVDMGYSMVNVGYDWEGDPAKVEQSLKEQAKNGDEGAKRILESGFTIDNELSSKMSSGKALVMVSEKAKEAYVVFRGTHNISDALETWLSIGMLGMPLSRQETANEILRSVKENYPGYQLTAAGHSLGGNIVMNASKEIEGFKGVIFSAPDGLFGIGTRAAIRNAAREQLSPLTHIRAQNDLVSEASTFLDTSKGVNTFQVPNNESRFDFNEVHSIKGVIGRYIHEKQMHPPSEQNR